MHNLFRQGTETSDHIYIFIIVYRIYIVPFSCEKCVPMESEISKKWKKYYD